MAMYLRRPIPYLRKIAKVRLKLFDLSHRGKTRRDPGAPRVRCQGRGEPHSSPVPVLPWLHSSSCRQINQSQFNEVSPMKNCVVVQVAIRRGLDSLLPIAAPTVREADPPGKRVQ